MCNGIVLVILLIISTLKKYYKNAEDECGILTVMDYLCINFGYKIKTAQNGHRNFEAHYPHPGSTDRLDHKQRDAKPTSGMCIFAALPLAVTSVPLL